MSATRLTTPVMSAWRRLAGGGGNHRVWLEVGVTHGTVAAEAERAGISLLEPSLTSQALFAIIKGDTRR